MTLLFKRAARVVVDTIELVVDPASPGNSLDLSFSVVRSLKPEPNTAEIQIWNLNEDNRSALEDKGTLPGSVAKGEPPPKPPPGIACTIEAGYEEQTALLYSGTLRVAYTTREGADLITTLSAGDGEKEYQRSRVNLSIAKGTPNTSVLEQVQKALGINAGNLSTAAAALASAPILFPQGGVLSGSASQIMTRVAQSLGFEWSIQEGALQLLQNAEPLAATATLLTPSTGLVGTPSIDVGGILTAQALMIPDIFPGRLIVLESERLTGNYRVETCNYSGNTAGPDWYIDIEAKKLG
jgi:hypothetical protein